MTGFEVFDLLVADLDALLVGPEVEFSFDGQSSFFVVVALMVSMTTSCEVSGRARQLRLIAENSRSSILFDLEVPGGRWQTVIARPVSVARAASSVFHSRSRDRWTRRNRR